MLRKGNGFLALLLALLLIGLTACGNEGELAPAQPDSSSATEAKEPDREADDASLTQLRAILADGDYLCGIAFLGTLPDGDLEQLSGLMEEGGYLEEYPFLESLPQRQIIATEGAEVYCLVPRDQNATLTVREWISNEQNQYQGEAGQTLYDSAQGQPVILIGNVNDVIPNLQITLTGEDGQQLVYTPCLNLCSGQVDLPATPSLYDFSRYPSEEAPAATDFLGTWQAAGSELTFSTDSTMTFRAASAEPMTGTFYVISNSSQYPAGSVLFEMKSESTEFWGIFTLTRSGNSLTVTNVSGDLLLDSQTTIFTMA